MESVETISHSRNKVMVVRCLKIVTHAYLAYAEYSQNLDTEREFNENKIIRRTVEKKSFKQYCKSTRFYSKVMYYIEQRVSNIHCGSPAESMFVHHQTFHCLGVADGKQALFSSITQRFLS